MRARKSTTTLVEAAGIELAAFAIDPPPLIPCLDVPNQIAQKLHACTEPLPDGNDRVRDILDIWLLESLLDPADLPSVKTACVTTFARRQRHSWPPTVEPSRTWSHDYQQLVADQPDAPPGVEAALGYLRDLIKRIDRAQP